MSPRAGLFIGIDGYASSPLSGCEADALSLSGALARNADGSLNFQCQVLVSSEQGITRAKVLRGIEEIFTKAAAEVAIFYFAGHGCLNAHGAFLVTQDATEHDMGVPMVQLLAAANASKSQERIVVLDCCFSGAIDELFATGANIPLADGVSILAACRRDQAAEESTGQGLFTSHVCEALDGGAADVRGAVTVASIYSYVDQILTVWQQRPIFKTNVSRLTRIRCAAPSVSDEKLRKITEYFPTERHFFRSIRRSNLIWSHVIQKTRPRSPTFNGIEAPAYSFRAVRSICMMPPNTAKLAC